MVSHTSIDHYLKKLSEEFKKYKSLSNSFLKNYRFPSEDKFNISVQTFFDASVIFKKNFAEGDTPSWLREIIQALNSFISNPKRGDRAGRLLLELMDPYLRMHNHSFRVEGSEQSSIDFDKIYQECKSESRLTEMFDKILEALIKIVKSGKIDSVQMIKKLEKTIASIKSHNTSSYFSLVLMWNIVISLTKNVAWSTIKEVPGMKGIAEGIEKTIVEVGPEFEIVKEKVVEKLSKYFDFQNIQLPEKLNNNKKIS